MDEDQLAEHVPKALTIGLTVAAVAAVVGVAVRLDRAYQRAYKDWSKDMSPLTKPRERVLRFKTTYRRRRLDASDFGALVNELWDEIDLARGLRR
jgi:hypothetical protein